MTGPVLRNFLADLAERIGEHVGRYRRATLTAAESVLEAGRLLVETRAECRHGEWLGFLERAGLADRTARNWMRLARSGLDAPNIVTAGGVRAALLTLANPKAIAIVERQVDELAAETKSATVADLPNPGRALSCTKPDSRGASPEACKLTRRRSRPPGRIRPRSDR